MVRSTAHDRREFIPAVVEPKYFKRLEFECCTPPCKLEDLDSYALEKLDKLRELCGFPLMLNCAYRSVEHDKSKGRSGNSYHCCGRAFDIYCTDSSKRFRIIQAAFIAGFNGIGVYKTFIHVDDRNVGCIWYGET